MKIYLIRHGQTGRNANPDLIGQSPEEPLSELGVQQAMALGKRFQAEAMAFKEVYCSPYKRAMQTCHLALPDCKPTVVDDLREYSAGEAEDCSRSEMITFETLNAMRELGMHFTWPGGETLFEVEERAAKWLYQVMQQYKDERVNLAVFSHGMTIKCLLHYIMQFDHHTTWRIDLRNTSVSVVEYKLGHRFIKSINDNKHL